MANRLLTSLDKDRMKTYLERLSAATESMHTSTHQTEPTTHNVVRDVMPVVGRTPGAAEPLQESGTGPDRTLDLRSRFTRLLSWLQLEGSVPVILLLATMMDCRAVSLAQLSGSVPASAHLSSASCTIAKLKLCTTSKLKLCSPQLKLCPPQLNCAQDSIKEQGNDLVVSPND